MYYEYLGHRQGPVQMGDGNDFLLIRRMLPNQWLIVQFDVKLKKFKEINLFY